VRSQRVAFDLAEVGHRRSPSAWCSREQFLSLSRMPVVRSVAWITRAQINGRDRTVLRRRGSAVDKYNELPALHSITSSARSARASIVAGMVSAWGRQRPRSCETAPGLGSILPRRTASQKGITCSTRRSGSPWRGQDDRLRRSSRTHRWVASIPPRPCTTRAERSNAGPSFRSAFENRASANRNHGSRRIRATTVIKCTFTVIQDYLIQRSNRCPPRLRMLYSGFSHERQEDIGPFG
jgi:hypothetical protein